MLRMRRLAPDDNQLRKDDVVNIVPGFELEWLAFELYRHDVEHSLTCAGTEFDTKTLNEQFSFSVIGCRGERADGETDSWSLAPLCQPLWSRALTEHYRHRASYYSTVSNLSHLQTLLTSLRFSNGRISTFKVEMLIVSFPKPSLKCSRFLHGLTSFRATDGEHFYSCGCSILS